MRGTRPLTDEEIEIVSGSFSGRFELRDRALFLLGVKSGFRISELLSLRLNEIAPKRIDGRKLQPWADRWPYPGQDSDSYI